MDGYFHLRQHGVDELHDMDQRRVVRNQNDSGNRMECYCFLFQRHMDEHLHCCQHSVDFLYHLDKRCVERDQNDC